MNNQILIDVFHHSLQQISALIGEVPDGRACEQPAGVRNHPAWTLTHLCVGNDLCLQWLGEATAAPKAWVEVGGNGTMPVPDAKRYPSKSEALAILTDQVRRISDAVKRAPATQFDAPMPPPFNAYFPTIGHGVTYFLTAHMENHLGQLLAWKRAAGLAKG